MNDPQSDKKGETPRTDGVSRLLPNKEGCTYPAEVFLPMEALARQLERELFDTKGLLGAANNALGHQAHLLSARSSERDSIIEECARVCDGVFLQEQEAGDVDANCPDNAWSRICARVVRALKSARSATAPMTLDRALEILKGEIQEDGGLFNGGHYIAWTPGDKDACLDCRFTAEELEAIAFWMKRAAQPEAGANE